MRFNLPKTMLLLGAAAILSPAMASAQVRDLDQAQSDVRVFQGTVDSAAAEFEVSVPANSVMQIDVLSTSDLDPVVTVIDSASGEQIAYDDDGGENLNSRVRVRGEDNGRRITISVNSFDADWVEQGESYGGSFDLRLETRAFVPVATRGVTYGASETGEIMGEENLFTIQGVEGALVEIALIATGDETLDPYLELRDADGETIAFNDDGGNGLNSYLRHTFEDDGIYTIAAMGFGESTGEYRLRVRDRRANVAQLPLQVIGIDDMASGELSSTWDTDETLTPSHIDYQLSEAALAAIRAGNGQVTIRMNAVEGGDADFGGDIDSYLEIGFDTPLGFAVADSDDDGGEGVNSMLPVDLGLIAESADLLSMLRIRAQGYGGSGGAYTLVITEGMEARPDYSDYAGDEWPAEIMIPAPAQVD